MNMHFIFHELRDLKNRFREYKQANVNILYNQMLLATSNDLENIILDDLSEVDTNRTTADKVAEGFTSTDGSEKVIYTNDYQLGAMFGDFYLYTYKDSDNLNVQVLVSNEAVGESFVEAEKTKQKTIGAEIEETFIVSKGTGSRLRVKVIIDKIDDTGIGTITRLNTIYQ